MKKKLTCYLVLVILYLETSQKQLSAKITNYQFDHLHFFYYVLNLL